MKPRTLKVVAIAYCVKTLLVGVAWLCVPDLPTRTATHVRRAWARIHAARPVGEAALTSGR